MVSLLQKEGFDCWVMPLRPRGELLHLYDGVNLVDTPFAIRALAASSFKDMPSLPEKIGASLFRFLRNYFAGFERKTVGAALNKIIHKHHFDTIVAGQEDTATRYVSYAECDNKVAWIRCDYKRYFEDRHCKKEGCYQGYDAIVCVADQTCINFKSIYPEHATRIHYISNPQDSELIVIRANEDDRDTRFVKKGKTLVSIGRLDAIKRFDHIAPIARQLLDNGLQFRWYLIGDGGERHHIAESIREFGVEDCVIMLGAKTNPYYYIKRADALVCLSRSEACPRAVNEAKILHVPTVSTDFPTIYEFIKDGKTGLISTLENVPLAIMRLFTEEGLYNHIKANISQFEFDNSELMDRLKTIL